MEIKYLLSFSLASSPCNSNSQFLKERRWRNRHLRGRIQDAVQVRSNCFVGCTYSFGFFSSNSDTYLRQWSGSCWLSVALNRSRKETSAHPSTGSAGRGHCGAGKGRGARGHGVSALETRPPYSGVNLKCRAKSPYLVHLKMHIRGWWEAGRNECWWLFTAVKIIFQLFHCSRRLLTQSRKPLRAAQSPGQQVRGPGCLSTTCTSGIKTHQGCWEHWCLT